MCVFFGNLGLSPASSSLLTTLQSGWPIGQVNQARGKGRERERRQRGHVRGGVPAAIAIVRVWLSSSGISLALVEREKGGGEEGGGWVCID